jgi:serine protease AprX
VTAEVSEELREKLADSEEGRIQAVITTHDRAGLAELRRLGVRGTELRALPMMLARGLTEAQLSVLERSPAVRSIWDNRRYEVQMEDTTWITGARYVWGPSAPTRFGGGYTGDGVHIAVIDTGIDGMHEDADNLVEFCDTTAAATGSRTEVVCTSNRAQAFDDDGHGTHVSGTIAGTGDASGGMTAPHSTIGIAPEASLTVYSSNVGPVLLNFQILAAYDDMIWKKLNANSGVVATSNSFGGGDGATYAPDDPQNVAIKAAYDAGILSVYAAGNSGPEHNTLSDSCINPWAICVGATTKPDSVVMFSSRGRPSEPADTNRDGVVGGEGDVEPDNHDRRLGQQLGIGLYRPTLVAPGVNINSMSANSAGCREGGSTDTGCYEALNGTSMATPHVSGAIAVIVDAWREEHGGTPSPAQIIDVLERSAAVHKLPGYEAEEQGAGRLNVWDAVRYIRGERDLPRPNFGTPSPVYTANGYPGHAATKSATTGCTGALSYTAGNANPIDEPADQPPSETERFSTHLITVPNATERLRVTITWPNHPDANLYARLWRPGVDPDDEFSSVHSERTFPDQEAVGLLATTIPPTLPTRRWLDIRAPEAGTWELRVYHRAGGEPGTCDPPGPEVSGGYSYDYLQEITISARTPSVSITSPAAGSTHTGRVITFKGTASYPTRWDGVSWWEVPGTGIAAGEDVEDPRVQLHFQGNTEEGCSGDGSADMSSATCNGGKGPSLLAKTALSSDPAASYNLLNPILGGNVERHPLIPNWIWDISSETTLRGPMTVSWWASCSACGDTLGSADWNIRLYADGQQQFQQRITATPDGPDTPTLLTTTVDLPIITASDRFVLHVDPVYIDSQNNVRIYYDSEEDCTGGNGPACDSTVLMPVFDPDSVAPEQARNVSVTDIHSALRVAWDPSPGATSYRIHRSTNPAFVPSNANLIATVAGTACTSPRVPSWPSASRTGALCYTDSAPQLLRTYYYRVVAAAGSVRADPSLLAYGTRSLYDRQVRLKADRLYGPGLWGFARLGNASGGTWRYSYDTFGRPEGTTDAPNVEEVFARSFTQGIGSAKRSRTIQTEGPAPETPFDPVVLFRKTGPATAERGDTITYRLSYENLGPAPSSGARVEDTLPAGLVFVSASNGGVWNSSTRTVTWRLGTVPEGAAGTLTLRVRIPSSAPIGHTYVNQARYRALLTFATPLGTAETTVVP